MYKYINYSYLCKSEIEHMAKHDKVTPYESGEESKKGQVTKMFDKIAPYYDFLNRLLSLGIDTIWRKNAINMLIFFWLPKLILCGRVKIIAAGMRKTLWVTPRASP